MPPTYRDLLDQVKSRINEVDAAGAQALLDSGAQAIDVREPDEVAQGVIPGAAAIPRGFLEARIEDTVRDRDEPVVIYCAGGARSAFAAEVSANCSAGSSRSSARSRTVWGTQ